MTDQTRLRRCTEKHRAFVISDISNEPDDAESLVRFLLYGNEFDIRGLVACTSTWMRNNVHPEDMQRIVSAYGQVVDNLNAHVHPENQYPSESYLQSIIKSGPACYGREALADGVPLSTGSALLIEQLEASERPLWVLSWGGTNVIAQALQHIDRTRSQDAKKLRSRLRVYAISDQDDTGMWIRVNYPDVFYICSVHGWKEYGMAAWVGISGDLLMPLDEGGPDVTKVKKEWLKAHIQIGPLGEQYPDYSFIMEGDTPTFLYLIQNGLGSAENPHWGSWGGRYVLGDIGGASNHYMDAKDTVIGKNGNKFTSNQATIWRWRDAFQNDFAARIQWTLGNDRSKANHAPVVIVNDSTAGPEPFLVEAEAGSELTLDACKTYDPDGDELSLTWYQYKEPTTAQSHIHWHAVPDVEFKPVTSERGPTGSVVTVSLPPPEASAVNLLTGQALEKGQALHFILEVKDSGSPSLITYKRVIVQITNRDLRGGKGKAFDTITEALGHPTK
ncbi:hypothetical protein BJY04DRAFT_233397 [Aspergillus karnatakaensis]|uniref:uncharacterized protein n=1 Tax=Aspergillus karnatakaensis TaxID=1810916 RepID=UPI003CCD3316